MNTLRSLVYKIRMSPVPLILVVFLALVVSVETGILINNYMYYQSVGEEIPAVSIIRRVKPTVAPIVTTTPAASAETANWKTYTNEKYSFRYPSDWLINNKNKQNTFDITVESSSQSFSVLTNLPGFGEECYVSFSKEKAVIDNIGGTIEQLVGVTDKALCNNSDNSKFVIGVKKDATNYLLMFGYKSTDKGIAKEVLDQILSTFRFTK